MRLSWLILLPLLAACNSTPSAVNEGTATPAVRDSAALPAPDTAHTKAVTALADTLRTARAQHNFSNPDGPPDTFQLVFRGTSLLEGTGEFTIADARGQVIFREVLTAPDLEASLVYEMKKPTATRAEREAFVRQRIDQFFRPAQFHAPAVGPRATFPARVENLDHATWADLQRRPGTVGFDYLKGKEDRQRLAWSPLKKQTVRVQ